MNIEIFMIMHDRETGKTESVRIEFWEDWKDMASKMGQMIERLK